MEERLLGRAQKDGANARSDDNVEVIKKRFRTFRDETMPIIDLYRKKNMVWIVSADRPIDEVYEQVHALAQDVFLPSLALQQTSVAKGIQSSKPFISTPTAKSSGVDGENIVKIVAVVSAVTAVSLLAVYVLHGKNKL